MLVKRWHLDRVILMALIAIICGIISFGTNFIYNGLAILLTPLGLKPFANDASLGLWMLASPLAASVVKVPGAAFLAEVVSIITGVFFGDQWGIIDLVFGAVQGLGSEAGFALTRYHHYDGWGLSIAAITGTIVTFIFDLFAQGYDQYPMPLLEGLLLTRLLSLLIFSDLFPIIITRFLRRSYAVR